MSKALSSRTRILQIGKYYFPEAGGIETYVRTLCEGISKEVDLHVLVCNKGFRTVRENLFGVSLTRAGSVCVIARTPVCPGLLPLIVNSNAQIIHLHEPNPAALLALIIARPKAKLVITYHMDIVRQRFLGKLVRPLQQLALRRAAAIIVTSEEYLSSSKMLQPYSDRCKVVPIGIDLSAFAIDRPAEVAKIHQLFGNRIVLAVGRLVSYKGFDVLVTAMAGINAKCLIIGEGPEHSNLRQKIQQLGIGHKVELLGKVEDLVPYYQACRVFVLPSVTRVEAFGIVQVEAMACGKPVVNTFVESGTHKVSLDGETGCTVPPGDPDALAAALTRLLSDSDLSKKFGEAARVRSREKFSSHAMIAKVLDVYTGIMEGVPRKACGL